MSTNEYQKYPTDKKKYDKEYLRVFGVECWQCKGKEMLPGGQCDDICPTCNGLGYIPKPKGSDYLRMKKEQERGTANYE